jgi:hypothetical protein
MFTHKRLYVAATSQHVGKTTSTLGLIAALRKSGRNVGYCKPAGQKYVLSAGQKVDKDAHLFADFLDFPLRPEWHSPVILEPRLVREHIEQPIQASLIGPILAAAEILDRQYDLVVYEGTGHPGVGSTVGISNAEVARQLGAGVILVAEAGIGSTLDMLALNMAAFQAKGVPIVGVILNKTRKDKMEKVAYYVGKRLEQLGIPLLGLLPFEEELSLPQVGNVAKAVKGDFLYFPEGEHASVRSLVAGAQLSPERLAEGKLLLVTSPNRLDEALQELQPQYLAVSPFSGMVLCGKKEVSPEAQAYIQQHRLPVIHTHLDTYEVVLAFGRLEVKINCKTPWKARRAVELFREYIHPERMFQYAG